MIRIQKSRIIIDDIKDDNLKPLLNSLSVWDQNLHHYTWCSYVSTDDGVIIPKGYSLQKLSEYLPYQDVCDDDTCTPSRNIKLKLKCNPRDKLQSAAIEYLLEDELSQKFLCLKTGKGKTYCTINYITQREKAAIIVVDMDNLITQWKNEFFNFTNIKDDQIYVISGSQSISKLMDMTKKDIRKYKIFLASHKTLASYADEDYSKINDLFEKIEIGIKVFDEAHVEWKNSFLIDAACNIKYNIYLTATPDRSNPIENNVFKNMYHSVPIFGLTEKYKDKYHYICYVTWDSQPTDLQKVSMISNRGFDSNEYSEYLLKDKYTEFSDILFKVLDPLLIKDPNTKIALVFQKNNIIDEVYKLILSKYPNLTIGKFCGLTNKKEKVNELQNQIILSTGKSFNKAVDVKGLEVVINFMTFSSKVIAEQVIGRLRYIEGKKLFYFDITDVGFEGCRYQSSYRKNIFNKIVKKSYKLKL